MSATPPLRPPSPSPSPAAASRRREPATTSIPFLLTSASRWRPSVEQCSVPRLSPLSRSRLTLLRASTTAFEQAPSRPPQPESSGEVSRLRSLRSCLSEATSLREKLRVLSSDSRVAEFFREGEREIPEQLEPFQLYLLKCLVAAGQEHVLGDGFGVEIGSRKINVLRNALSSLGNMIEIWSLDGIGNSSSSAGRLEGGDGKMNGEAELLKKLLETLGEIEHFYDCIGGIIGYQIMALELLLCQKAESCNSRDITYMEFHVPAGFNLMDDKELASEAALWGIEGLPELGEIYPIGGAGDRLGLVDPVTGECLPAALLPYCGRTLLEGLIRDLQAREFLYFKIFGRQCITPVAVMTSSVKNNHAHLTAVCENNGWFGRNQKNFLLFEQPLVPVVAAKDGKWLTSGPLDPVCKPGGHGAVWKLAHDKGVFQWFRGHGRKGVTVRQVSNVVAATDVTIVALAGLGLRHNKKLGFASCDRNPGATEGINVLVERENLEGQWSYGISCVEYTEFDKYGITDMATSNDGFQESFPANTNILYVNLLAAEKVGASQDASCLPGIVLNLKKSVTYLDHHGFECSSAGGRLECTMQNIADSFFNTYNSRCSKAIESELDTFIVYNERKRVTSSAKRKHKLHDRSLHQTPEGSLLDVLRNARDLLSDSDRNLKIPKVEENSKYLHTGPPFLIFLHPALGPLWDIIREKFSGGSISFGSELQVEVAEFFWKDVELDGSLLILADNVMGSLMPSPSGEQTLQYGTRCARCKLQRVKVLNEGIIWDSANNVYWKHDVERSEAMKIVLHGNAEFEAEDVVFKGSQTFEVPDGHRMTVNKSSTGFDVKLEEIPMEMAQHGSWYWRYAIEGTKISLDMVDLCE